MPVLLTLDGQLTAPLPDSIAIPTGKQEAKLLGCAIQRLSTYIASQLLAYPENKLA